MQCRQPWLFRCLFFGLSLLLCLHFISANVSAAAYDPGYQYSYDILSLTTADGDNHVSVGESGSVTFDLPYVLNGNYVDVVISTSSGAITAAQCGNASAQQDLNVLAVSNRVFRVYGTINNRSFTELQLNLTTNNASTSVDFLSFRLFKPAVNIHQTVGRLSCMVLSLAEQHYGQTYYGEVLAAALPWETGQSEIDTASILLAAPEWQKFDYVEFMVYGKFSSVDAIVARVDDVSVPFKVTPLDGSADVFASHSDNVWRNMVISVDVREVVRSNTPSEDLRLRVDMNLSYFNGAQAMFYMNTVNGIIDSGLNVTEDFWYFKILSALSSGFDSVVDGVSVAGSSVVSALSSVVNAVSSAGSSVVSAIGSGVDSLVLELQSGFPSVVSAIDSVRTAVNNLISGFTQWVNSSWNQFVSGWRTTISGFKTSVESKFDTLWTNISSRWDSFQTWLESVLDPDASDVEDQAGELENNINQFEQIEQEFQQDFDDNIDIVTGAFNFATFLNAFGFVSTILNGTFSGLADYRVVYTVPLAIAIFLFILGHVPRYFSSGSVKPKDVGHKTGGPS